jgi:chemotaxis protein CheX
MEQIVSSVFQDMLQMPTAAVDSCDPLSGSTRMVASIRITGATEATITVEAPVDTARGIGETMFATQADSLDEEEVRDAIGEIANMIGGNVKGMYEGESHLSLPCVSEETEDLCRTEIPQSAAFHVCGLPIHVHWKTQTA